MLTAFLLYIILVLLFCLWRQSRGHQKQIAQRDAALRLATKHVADLSKTNFELACQISELRQPARPPVFYPTVKATSGVMH